MILKEFERISQIYISFRRGRGNTGTSPFRNRKNFCRNLLLSSRGTCLGVESEIQETFSKKLGKSQFSIESLIKNSQNLLKNFRIFFIFGRNAQDLAGRLLTFSCRMGILPQFMKILHFSTRSTRVSPKISRIFMPFSRVLYLSYFLRFFL